LLKKDGKIALILREHTSWMNDHYSLPAGKVEKKESYTQAAIREAKEEAGIDVATKDLKYIHTMHRNEGLEWVDVFFEVTNWQGQPHNAEPHKHGELAWFSLNDLPKNTIPSLKVALEAIQRGELYSEYGFGDKS
jgi:ADP-ribose pyrophosphatase YjhB (NUDIX family)